MTVVDPDGGRGHGRPVVGRRALIGGLALAGAGGAALGVRAEVVRTGAAGNGTTGPGAGGPLDTAVAFHGTHQAGVATPAPSLSSFLALDLLPPVEGRGPGPARDALARLLRLWTDDLRRLTAGSGALGDQEGDSRRPRPA